MADAGAEYVDRKLYNLEKRVAREYRRANREVQAKLNNYLMKFAEQEKIMRARLEAGDITQKDYNDFIFRKTMTGKRWQAMRDTLASDYHNANMIARSITEGYLPGAYAINHDYATYEVEHDGHFDTNYTLYNRHTAENLLSDEYKLIPDPKPGTEAYRRSQSKDLRWNMQKVQSAVLQGVLQGSRLSEIAANLERVTDMNHSAAVRNARTMMTAAQNAGRQDAYERAQKMSINLEKVWIATLDNRTRHSHRLVHGERRPINASFSNGCRFPADPEAPPSEVYRCRCTMGAAVEGVDLPIVKHSPKMGTLSFEEWREGKLPKDMDVTGEYKATAKPGRGKVVIESGVKGSNDEIKMAHLLHSKYGGTVTVLAERHESGVKTPDFRWRAKYWDLKTVSTEKSVDGAIRRGLKQIAERPGGIIIDFADRPMHLPTVKEIIDGRMKRGYKGSVDIIIVRNGKPYRVYRYK